MLQPEDPKIIVALDYSNPKEALAMAERLPSRLCRLKVGKELFTLAGPQLVEALQAKGFEVFLDLKFHDIPNTVAKAVSVAASLGVWMVNVHASGGEKMMSTAVNALQSFKQKPLLIAVTVLTSMSEAELNAVGVKNRLQDQVINLATLSQQSGLDGVVCSALEVREVRHHLGSDFCLVTPGIRPQGSANDDQTRIVTPDQALAWGSDYLVMGRPIRNHADPIALMNSIYDGLR